MEQPQNIITDFHPESMSDITYRWVGLTGRVPNNPNNANITKEAGEKVSCCVKQASESSVWLNKASAKKNGMWLQLAKDTPHIYFDVGVHKDLKRWIENNWNSLNPTELEVYVCNGENNELLCLTSS